MGIHNKLDFMYIYISIQHKYHHENHESQLRLYTSPIYEKKSKAPKILKMISLKKSVGIYMLEEGGSENQTWRIECQTSAKHQMGPQVFEL